MTDFIEITPVCGRPFLLATRCIVGVGAVSDTDPAGVLTYNTTLALEHVYVVETYEQLAKKLLASSSPPPTETRTADDAYLKSKSGTAELAACRLQDDVLASITAAAIKYLTASSAPDITQFIPPLAREFEEAEKALRDAIARAHVFLGKRKTDE